MFLSICQKKTVALVEIAQRVKVIGATGVLGVSAKCKLPHLAISLRQE